MESYGHRTQALRVCQLIYSRRRLDASARTQNNGKIVRITYASA